MSADPVDRRALLLQPVGEEEFRRFDTDTGKDHIHVLFGTAVEDPAVGVRIGKGLKIGNGPLFGHEVIAVRLALQQFRRKDSLAAGIGIRAGLELQPTKIHTLH